MESGQEPRRDSAPPVRQDDPEAQGFGRRRGRFWGELAIVAAVVVTLPLGAVWGARALAERVAVRLPPEMDAQLGRPSWEALQVSGERCESSEGEAYVRALASPLLAAAGPTPFEFQFMLARSEDVNAFALPGGYVVVNVGLLRAAKSGEEVAAVLAHELSHVTLRHSTKRLASSLGATAALAFVLGFVDVGAPAYGVAHLAGLSYERDQESEADDVGMRLLTGAGLSPLGMATFFERLREMPQPPEMLSTHPDPGGRAERARRAAEGFQASVSLSPPPDVRCDRPPK